MYDNIDMLYLCMLEETNRLISTSLQVLKLRYSDHAPKIDTSPTFYKTTQNKIYKLCLWIILMEISTP